MDRLKELVDEAPITRVVNLILSQAINDGASHIHIEGEAKMVRVRYRVDGVLHEVMNPPKHIHLPIVARIKKLAGMNVADHQAPQSGLIKLTHDGRDFHLIVSSCPTLHGERVVIRLTVLDGPLPQLDDFGPAAARLESIIERPHGLVLVAGPAGSGRSTLVAKLLSLIDNRHVVQCEPGYARHLPGVTQVDLSGPQGLVETLPTLIQQDTDVVAVPQCWKQEELGLLLQMAASRSLVLASWLGEDLNEVHTRLLESAPEPHLVPSALRAIVVLRTFPKLCSCSLPEASPDLIRLLGDKNWRSRGGCDRCKMTGLRGRIWACEVQEFPFGDRGPTLREQALQLAEAGLIEAGTLGAWLTRAPA